MSEKPVMESVVVYRSDSCNFEEYTPLVGRTVIDIGEVFDWALRNSDSEFGLGVLAAMNYVTCRDEKTPEERLNDRRGICKAANSCGEVTLDWECYK